MVSNTRNRTLLASSLYGLNSHLWLQISGDQMCLDVSQDRQNA
jgi:hypothetical protein